MSGSGLPPLRPLAASGSRGIVPDPGVPAAGEEPLPWEARSPVADSVEAELKMFCREGELVYAAIVDHAGEVKFSVCTVGSRPQNEVQIGELVGSFFATASALGEEVGERRPQGLNLQGSRWSYSLDPIDDGQLLFGIYPSRALPGIVRACAQKTCAALEGTLAPGGPE